MRRSRPNRWRHALFPQVGGRIAERRRWVERRLPLLVWAYYLLFAWTTPRLFAVASVGLLPMAGMFAVSIENAVTYLGFSLGTVILASIAVGGFLRPNVSVVSEMPRRVECGRPFTIRYQVANTAQRGLYDLAVESMPSINLFELRLSTVQVAHLPAGRNCTVDAEGLALRRGRYRMPPLRCDSDFPLGLWRWGRTDWTERLLTVHPAYTRLTALELPDGARNRLDLQEARQLTRAALEFHGCREFRAGDALRHVHARSSARLGIPVIKEFQAEGRGRTAIVVDTWCKVPSPELGLRPDPVVEAALSLTAAIVDFLARSDRALELLVAGPGVYRFVSAGRVGFFEDVLDILASVEANRMDTLPQLVPMLVDEIRSVQSVCLILGRWDDRRAAFVRELSDHGVGVKTLLVSRRTKGLPAGLPTGTLHLGCHEILRGEVTSL